MRTTQTRKRSRSSNYGSRGKRRRIMKRARFAGPRAVGVNQYGQRIRTVQQRRRRSSRRQYRRNLYNYSSMLPKFQVATAGSVTRTTPASLTQYDMSIYRCLEGIFDQTNWAAMDNSTLPTSVTSPVYVRGGEERLTIACEAAEQIDYKVQLVWISKAGSIPSNGTVNKGGWAGNTTSGKGNETAKVMKEWVGTLSYTGGSASFVYKPKMKIYKKEWFVTAQSDCMYWYIFLGNTVDATGVSVTIHKDSSCTVGYLNV